MYFDVLEPCTLKTVKVYTDIAGTRNITLHNSNGQLVHNTVVNVQPDSQIVQLDWILTPGTQYAMSTDTSYNQQIPGLNANGPRFRRNSVGVSYPYLIGNLISITNSSFGPQYYYYFYDWKVEKAPELCASQRVPVTAYVKPTVSATVETQVSFSLYPNPADEITTLQISSPSKVEAVQLLDLSGRIVKTLSSKGNIDNFVITRDGLAAGCYILRIVTREWGESQTRIVWR
jgi:hypothetical protein